MGRRVVLVSVVLLLTGLVAFPGPVAAQPSSPRTPPRFSDPDPNPTPPPPAVAPPATAEPPTPAEPLTPTILSEPPTEPTAPVPVIPLTIPTVEGAPPPSTISSAPTRVLPTLTDVGESRPVFVFQPSVSLSEEYTDNFDLTKTNKHSNFRTAIAPSLLFSLDSAFLKGIIGYTFTANHDSFTDEMLYFHSVSSQISWQATPRLRFTVADAFTHNDEPSEADSLSLRRERTTFTSNAFSLSADYLIDRVETRTYFRWNTFSDSGGGSDTNTQAIGATAAIPLYTENTLTMGYEYLTSHTSESNGDTSQGSTQTFEGSQDVSGHQITASIGRKFNPLLTAGLSGSYAFRNVSGSAVNSGNFQLWNASLFGTYGTTPFTVTGRVGLTGLTSDSGGSRGPDLSLSTTASYAFARAVVSLALEHGFSETFEAGQNFGVVETTGATATLSYTPTTRVNTSLSAYYRKTETTGIGGGESIAGGPNIGSNTSDVNESVGATVTLSLALLRWLTLNLSYTYTHRFDNGSSGNTSTAQGSDNTNRGYTENRARIGLNFAF